ncbi:unnamed protein product [Ectocarpus sp. 6 AP-2014]
MARQPPTKGTPCAAIGSLPAVQLVSSAPTTRNGTPCAATDSLTPIQLVSSAPTTKKSYTLYYHRQPASDPTCNSAPTTKKWYTLHYHRQPPPIRLANNAQPPRNVYLAQPGHRCIARITQGGEVATRAKINVDSGWQKSPYNPVCWPPVYCWYPQRGEVAFGML